MPDNHSIKIHKVFENLKTNEGGLSQEEALKRLKKNGPNEMPKEKALSPFKIFISQFKSPLSYILLGAGVLSFILKEYIDSGVIFSAVLINVVIGFFQENKANQAISKLRSLVEQKCFVLRDGREIILDSSLLVEGDIIFIKAGNRIPVDARLFKAISLSVEEAALTGESIPADKKIGEIPKGASIADRTNMVFAGTVAVHGIGRAIVIATASQTEIGKIAEMVKQTPEEKTPLQIRLDNFSKILGIVFALISFLVVVIGIFQGRSFFVMLETGVALGVASIPEGLTISITFILALGMQRILKKKALTRKLLAAETLGSTTVICTDKTGTLTEGKMHVAHIVIGRQEFEMKSLGSRQDEKEAQAVSLALQIAMMCNNASIENPEDELASWRVIGSPTETALLSAAYQSGLRKEELLKHEVQIAELPFDSESKFMISLHQKKNGEYILYEKGAPEILLEKSNKYIHQGKEHILNENDLKILNETYEKLTNKGLRVVALARKVFRSSALDEEEINWKEIDKDLIFIGFIAIKDPLRPEAAETIALCKKAGIRPILITGDHQLTAKAIGEEVGLKIEKDNLITGSELEKIDNQELEHLVKKVSIYARVSPHHKLRIVKALQKRGEVVAMTGDGINDSPALKAADIGISLGTATDIAKETSDIILLDNNFKTIVEAVKQGRQIFKNIRKVVVFLISDSFSEIILILGSIILKMPLAILPAQILWVNIVNDGFVHFPLAFEKEDNSIMSEKPLKRNEPILNKEMKIIIFAVGLIRDLIIFAIFLNLYKSGLDISYIRTLIFVYLGIN
jgi:Ca2+-transporting ATPase